MTSVASRSSPLQRLQRAAVTPVDGASLVFFRLMFGLVMAGATLRFGLKGWIHTLYIAPAWHFSHFGMDWLRPWDQAGLVYGHFALIALTALAIGLGFAWRTATLLFALTFTAVELWDKATYLNHYVLVSLLAIALFWMPLSRAQLPLSTLWVAPSTATSDEALCHRGTVPAWCVWFVRVQLGLVYFFAGLAKVQPDWLMAAQPLATWLPARADLPLLGPLLSQPWTPHLWSWAGMFFDLTIPFWLCWRRTRGLAYLAVVGFHLVTASLFHIGVFPWLMMALTPVFFRPDWPRSWSARLRGASLPLRTPNRAPSSHETASPWLLPVLGIWLTMQVLIPLRHHLAEGEKLWNEAGFRFAWHVMIIEKNGSSSFRVHTDRGRFVVRGREELTTLQERQMSTQPDMLLQYAHRLRDRFRAEGHGDVRVFVDAYAALNGRRSQRLIDPEVNLANVNHRWAERGWVEPLHRRSFHSP